MRATPVRRPSRWRVGFLLPRTLVACIVLDALLRFAPVGWRPMEAGEAEVRHRIQGEAFARNLHIESSAAYGDLARIGNFRELREYRSYSFTTDEHGFRKGRRGSAAVAVVFGDSFAQAGRDGETLADQLAQVIGCDVYNAAGPDAGFQNPEAPLVTSITTRIPLRNGYVIVERLERLFQGKKNSPETQESSSLGALVGDVFDLAVRRIPGVWRIARIMENVKERTGSSPLKVIAERAFLVLKDDRILPNSYSGNVVKATLSNGDWMLFYPEELATYEQRWPVDISYWTSVAPAFEKIGLTLVVVLVPNKYSVYHMLLADPPPVAVEPGELLQRAEAQLRAAGIIVVNLTRPLELAAAQDVERHEYLYWRDDTHWNERGVAIAAAEIARRVPGLRQACASAGRPGKSRH